VNNATRACNPSPEVANIEDDRDDAGGYGQDRPTAKHGWKQDSAAPEFPTQIYDKRPPNDEVCEGEKIRKPDDVQ